MKAPKRSDTEAIPPFSKQAQLFASAKPEENTDPFCIGAIHVLHADSEHVPPSGVYAPRSCSAIVASSDNTLVKEVVVEPSPGKDPTSVPAPRPEDFEALCCLFDFRLPSTDQQPDEFLDAVVRQSLLFDSPIELSDTALRQARELHQELSRYSWAREGIIRIADTFHQRCPSVAIEQWFTSAAVDLFCTVMSVPGYEPPIDLSGRLAAIRTVLQDKGLLDAPDEIEWRQQVLFERAFTRRAAQFMSHIDPDPEPETPT